MSRQPQPRQSLLEKYFRDSETLLVARITSFGAFITGVIGALDWSPLLGISGFDRKQVIAMAGIVLLIGVSTEIARRMRSDA